MKKVLHLAFMLPALLLGSISSMAAEPTAAAPTPSALAQGKVISVFSEAFTNIAGNSNYNPNWGQATVSTVISVAGNATLSYATLNYQGLEFGNHLNVSDMVYLHVDAYTDDETTIKVSLISPGHEFPIDFVLTQGSWVGKDFALANFTGVDLTDAFQIKVEGTGGKTVYLDNIYFYDNSSTADAQAPTAFTATTGTLTFNTADLKLNTTDNKNFVWYTISYGNTTMNVPGTSGVEKAITLANLEPSTAYSVTVTASDLTGNSASNSPIVVSFSTKTPLVAAPNPPVLDLNKVATVFSDAFPNTAGATDFNPNWGQSTVQSIISLSGSNATLSYVNLNYQGMQFENHLNVSTLTTLHLDVYTEDLPSLEVSIISPGKENFATITLTAGQWKGYDIPLTSYTAPDLTDIFQIKFENKTVKGKTILVDNIYFSNNVTTVVGPTKVKPSLPVTFEDSTTVNYSIRDFAGNIGSAIVADPVDANNLVLKSVRSPGADGFQDYAGTAFADLGLTSKIPFSTGNTTLSARVYASEINTLICLKVEGAVGTGLGAEGLAVTTAVGWNDLTFDYSKVITLNGRTSQTIDVTKNYERLVIFYNFFVPGATQAVDKTYYIDNIMFEGTGTSVAKFGDNSDFSVYPNPSEGAFTIENNRSAGVSYQIINAHGLSVRSGSLANGRNTVGGDLNPGVYFFKANGTVKKLVVR